VFLMMGGVTTRNMKSSLQKCNKLCMVASCWTIIDTKSQLWNRTVSQCSHETGSALSQGVLTNGQFMLYKLHFRNVKYRFVHIWTLLMKSDIMQTFHNFSTSYILFVLFQYALFDYSTINWQWKHFNHNNLRLK
jgi:hypothetical protein